MSGQLHTAHTMLSIAAVIGSGYSLTTNMWDCFLVGSVARVAAPSPPAQTGEQAADTSTKFEEAGPRIDSDILRRPTLIA